MRGVERENERKSKRGSDEKQVGDVRKREEREREDGEKKVKEERGVRERCGGKRGGERVSKG